MKIFKKLLILPVIAVLTSALFSCSWEDVTVTPEGDPIVVPGLSPEKKEEPITSNGTYGLAFSEVHDFYVVTGYHGTEADVFIPAEWNGKPVLGINSYAFNDNSVIETITITSSIKSVSKNALVGNYKVFCETDDPHICTEEENCESIHPEGWHRYWYTDPSGNDMSADKEHVEWGCGSFGSFSWTSISDKEIAITGYIENPVSLTIPAKIGKRTVVSIKKDAFNGCSTLEEITLPDTLREIGSFAFRYCTSLKSITIPEGVTVISSYVFEECTSLAEVKLSPKTEKISNGAFNGCTSLAKIDIPSSVKTIETYAFHNCKNTIFYLWDIEGDKTDWFCDCIDYKNNVQKVISPTK